MTLAAERATARRLRAEAEGAAQPGDTRARLVNAIKQERARRVAGRVSATLGEWNLARSATSNNARDRATVERGVAENAARVAFEQWRSDGDALLPLARRWRRATVVAAAYLRSAAARTRAGVSGDPIRIATRTPREVAKGRSAEHVAREAREVAFPLACVFRHAVIKTPTLTRSELENAIHAAWPRRRAGRPGRDAPAPATGGPLGEIPETARKLGMTRDELLALVTTIFPTSGRRDLTFDPVLVSRAHAFLLRSGRTRASAREALALDLGTSSKTVAVHLARGRKP